MTPPSAAERALYSDLTRLLQRMRGESYARVEAAIEARFQAFVRAHGVGASAELAITHTMTVHDEPEPWAVYRTEYRVLPAARPRPAAAPDDRADAGNVIPFPPAFRSPLLADEVPPRLGDGCEPAAR
jgi:hypothetical protein